MYNFGMSASISKSLFLSEKLKIFDREKPSGLRNWFVVVVVLPSSYFQDKPGPCQIGAA